ncbi:hypothetical protein DMH02_000680 [Streptomyces sp. WAC 00631]|uniref:hypothetical protein n=1 Tax=unclassified Streptomyces TaxID=2593676 RepID=UPI000F78776C|nr:MULTISPECIES: hypothetical protein [unclassified Streptomyces]MCC5031818.1 hypothetical protein [Streptomyces sp. WAC 00631]MCC9739952.1 hypothetical protein [Streptomyces sp. MNU89]
MAEAWTTKEQLAAAMDHFMRQLPGWRRPAAHGLGLITPSGTEFPVVNAGEHYLPAAVLSTVCEHRVGTRTYPVTVDQLDEAIGLLAPAEACPDYDHPNLAAWRHLRHRLPDTVDYDAPASLVAVFVDRLDDPPAGAHDARFRHLLAQRAG